MNQTFSMKIQITETLGEQEWSCDSPVEHNWLSQGIPALYFVKLNVWKWWVCVRTLTSVRLKDKQDWSDCTFGTVMEQSIIYLNSPNPPCGRQLLNVGSIQKLSYILQNDLSLKIVNRLYKSLNHCYLQLMHSEGYMREGHLRVECSKSNTINSKKNQIKIQIFMDFQIGRAITKIFQLLFCPVHKLSLCNFKRNYTRFYLNYV